MTFRRAAFCILTVLSLLLPLSGAWAAATDEAGSVSRTILRVITEVVRPGFDAFAASSEVMEDVTAELCQTPTAARLAQSRDAFGDLVDDWSHIEFIRAGPLANDNRLERVMFWPDRRGRGMRQVQEAIRTSDPTVTDVGELAGKSVALQGIPALEYALFGDGADAIADGEASFRCAYAAAIAANIANIAAASAADWNDPEGYSKIWTEPSPENPLFRDGPEQLNGLMHMMGDGVEAVLVQRLAPVTGEDRQSMKPKSALLWRSGNFLEILRGNVEGLERLFLTADLHDFIGPNDHYRLDGTGFSFGEAIKALESLESPIAALSEDEEAYRRLAYAGMVLAGLVENFREAIPVMLGLSSGFSSLDGD